MKLASTTRTHTPIRETTGLAGTAKPKRGRPKGSKTKDTRSFKLSKYCPLHKENKFYEWYCIEICGEREECIAWKKALRLNS